MTKHQAEMYCCKYCAKHVKRAGQRDAIYDIVDEMDNADTHAAGKFGEENYECAKLGGKLHKTFMAEVGDEFCQAEVAHLANGSPEYLCSRREKHVCLYKRALAIPDASKKKEEEEDARAAAAEEEAEEQAEDARGGAGRSKKKNRRKQKTPPSDVELYEKRTEFHFEEGAEMSGDLPAAESLVEQVRALHVYDFFRYVRCSGGESVRLAWETDWPVVCISPQIRLTEGADFAFGARWALMQFHPWEDRKEFLARDDGGNMTDREVVAYFRTWVESAECPWYVREQYYRDSGKGKKGGAGALKSRRRGATDDEYVKRRQEVSDKDPAERTPEEAQWQDGGFARDQMPAAEEAEASTDGARTDGASTDGGGVSDVEEASDDDADEGGAAPEAKHLKILLRARVEEFSCAEEQKRKAAVFNNAPKHSYYKNARCTSRAQEEHSAHPAGVLNINEDSDDPDAYEGEQKEIAQEMDALRRVAHLVNPPGFEAAEEGLAASGPCEVDLRLDWSKVKSTLAKGAGGGEGAAERVDRLVVERDYALEDLDPTQRVFANRVIAWAREVVSVYKRVEAGAYKLDVPRLRSWLGGSAGSGKSTTLKTAVQHVRLMFQEEKIDAQIELVAYTGVAAFNIGFGAKTACSAFQVFPKARWKHQLKDDAYKRLEREWSSVELLIVDEVSFIGRAFFAKMHHRMQQGKTAYFARGARDPDEYTFGGCSVILVGDFGQLEPIDDWSMCEGALKYDDCPQKLRPLWKHQRVGKVLVDTFKEAIMLKRVHRSKKDTWWTESCLRLRDYTCTKEDDWDFWRQHDLDHGHLSEERKAYFERHAVWLCARCEDVGKRNGEKLAKLAEQESRAVHRISALHSRRSARKLPSSSFDGLRGVINLVRGCMIMITRNIAYNYPKLPIMFLSVKLVFKVSCFRLILLIVTTSEKTCFSALLEVGWAPRIPRNMRFWER